MVLTRSAARQATRSRLGVEKTPLGDVTNSVGNRTPGGESFGANVLKTPQTPADVVATAEQQELARALSFEVPDEERDPPVQTPSPEVRRTGGTPVLNVEPSNVVVDAVVCMDSAELIESFIQESCGGGLTPLLQSDHGMHVVSQAQINTPTIVGNASNTSATMESTDQMVEEEPSDLDTRMLENLGQEIWGSSTPNPANSNHSVAVDAIPASNAVEEPMQEERAESESAQADDQIAALRSSNSTPVNVPEEEKKRTVESLATPCQMSPKATFELLGVEAATEWEGSHVRFDVLGHSQVKVVPKGPLFQPRTGFVANARSSNPRKLVFGAEPTEDEESMKETSSQVVEAVLNDCATELDEPEDSKRETEQSPEDPAQPSWCGTHVRFNNESDSDTCDDSGTESGFFDEPPSGSEDSRDTPEAVRNVSTTFGNVSITKPQQQKARDLAWR